MSRAEDEQAARRVECPTCHAKPNHTCWMQRSLKDVRMVFLKHPHGARLAAWKATRPVTEVVLKSGETAMRINGLPHLWLVQRRPWMYWVIEAHEHEVDLATIDLDDMSYDPTWMIVATATKRNRLSTEGQIPCGWWLEVENNPGTEPYGRRQDALENMLAELRQNQSVRTARAAKEI